MWENTLELSNGVLARARASHCVLMLMFVFAFFNFCTIAVINNSCVGVPLSVKIEL